MKIAVKLSACCIFIADTALVCTRIAVFSLFAAVISLFFESHKAQIVQ
jgi:hypothetical protein